MCLFTNMTENLKFSESLQVETPCWWDHTWQEVWPDRKSVEIITCYSYGEQGSISKCTLQRTTSGFTPVSQEAEVDSNIVRLPEYYTVVFEYLYVTWVVFFLETYNFHFTTFHAFLKCDWFFGKWKPVRIHQ